MVLGPTILPAVVNVPLPRSVIVFTPSVILTVKGVMFVHPALNTTGLVTAPPRPKVWFNTVLTPTKVVPL